MPFQIALSSDWAGQAALDGCTAFAWNHEGWQWNGQCVALIGWLVTLDALEKRLTTMCIFPRNWDWKAVAVDLLIVLEIDAWPKTGRPAIKMMTEAGVVCINLLASTSTAEGHSANPVLRTPSLDRSAKSA